MKEVVVDEGVSFNYPDVTSGVCPQLFLIYANDLPDSAKYWTELLFEEESAIEPLKISIDINPFQSDLNLLSN